MHSLLPSDQAQQLRARYLQSFGLLDKRTTGEALTVTQFDQARVRDERAGNDRSLAETWAHNPKPNLVDRDRSRALLAGYVALCGVEFSAEAIECADGRFIRPDMQVMKAFRGGGYVEYVADTRRFRLSSAREQLIGLLPNQS